LARNVEQTVSSHVHQTTSELDRSWRDASAGLTDSATVHEPLPTPVPEYRHPKKKWRLKRGAMPQWYKQRHGIRGKAQSGAARVARFRPPRPQA